MYVERQSNGSISTSSDMRSRIFGSAFNLCKKIFALPVLSKRNDKHRTDKLLKEYAKLGPIYDQRWSAYIDASLCMTLESVANSPAQRVLDVGCGTGQLLEVLAECSAVYELVGIDRVPEMLDTAKRRLGDRALLVEGDVTLLPFDDANFQLITSSSALHYFPDVDVSLREIRRVISPGGNLIITDWCRNFFWMRMLNRVLPWTDHPHVHTFSVNEIEERLTLAGFNVSTSNKRKINWFWGLMTIHARPS